MSILIELFTGAGPAIAGLVAILLGVIGFGAVKKRAGKKQNQTEQREIDHETASDINDRVDAIGLRSDDELIYRDDEGSVQEVE